MEITTDEKITNCSIFQHLSSFPLRPKKSCERLIKSLDLYKKYVIRTSIRGTFGPQNLEYKHNFSSIELQSLNVWILSQIAPKHFYLEEQSSTGSLVFPNLPQEFPQSKRGYLPFHKVRRYPSRLHSTQKTLFTSNPSPCLAISHQVAVIPQQTDTSWRKTFSMQKTFRLPVI